MEQEKTMDLGKDKILPLMVRMAIPMVVAQVINVLYSTVDRIYVGNIPQVGSLALTGIGVCFPILMIVSAFAAFVGMGGAPQAAIKMGEQDQEGAQKILGTGVTLLVMISIVLTLLLLFFQKPLLLAFGGSENTIEYAQDYLSIYLLGTIFVQIAIGLNQFITCQGKPKIAMLSVIIGAIINIILDPIFIFGFDMGVKGAALATIISQAVSAIWVLRFLTGKKTNLRIQKKYLRLDKKIVMAIASLGIAPFMMQATESLVSIVLNASLQSYGGDMYVGAMTIILSVFQIFIMPINGFAQGVAPIISYNYGAKNMERVKKTFKYLLMICTTLTIIAWAVLMLIPGVIIRAFTPDPALLNLTVTALRTTMAGILMFGVTTACQSSFMALNQPKFSLFTALLRKIILLIPLALILPPIVGVMGIYAAQPIADVISAIICGLLFFFNFNKILNKKLAE